MIQNQNIPYHINGGDQVIMFTGKKELASISGVQNLPSLYSWYQEDPEKNHLGLVKLWSQQSTAKYPNLMRQLLADKAVMNVNGWDGGFTYELPIEEHKGCYTTRDVSYQEFAGVDGGTFKLILNRAYAPGDILTYDKFHGQQVVVAEDYPVEPSTEGFEHTVKIANENDKYAYLLPEFLSKGVEWFKIGHAAFGEEFTNYSNFEFPDTIGTMKCEFRLGSATAVESYISGAADAKAMSGASAKAKAYADKVMQEFNGGEYAILADFKVVNGKKMPDMKTAKLGATMEFLTMRELEKLTSEKLMWAQAATFTNSNGVTRINEGLYRQLRRGKIITYGRPGGLTREHIQEAKEYIFRGNYMKQDVDTRIHFKAGKFLYENFLAIFKDEIASQRDQLATFLGSDRMIPNPVSGNDPFNLTFKPIRFTNVFLPGIGMVSVEEDLALNNADGRDRLASGMHPLGLSETAYSAMIWDADSQMYSNHKELPKGVTMIEGGNAGANIHLVKPEGEGVYWGSENGRYDYRKAGDIISSGRKPGQNFWAFSIAAIHVMDVTRTVIIELEPAARKGFN